MQDKPKLSRKLKCLVNAGYVAVVLEMVSQQDGRVISPAEWNTICECCEEVGIYLVVDEALTVWRCGAPYAHLLPEYSSHKPSFVVFGKAVGASGLAVHWDGIHMKRLGYANPQFTEDQTDFVQQWDHKSSRNIDPNDALRSWGYIMLSEQDSWCERALRIGGNLRKWLNDNYPGIELRGRGAFVYLPAEDAEKMGIVGAAVNGKYIRWLPYLDEALKDDSNVEDLFNESGTAIRRIAAEHNLSTLRCIGCADHLHTAAYGPCPRCLGQLCNVCVSDGRQKRHAEEKCLSGSC